MRPKNWEATVQQIVDDSNREAKEAGKQKVLMGWRKTLAEAPHHFPLHHIDEIVREVRNRLKTESRPAGNRSSESLTAAPSPAGY